MVVYSTSVPLEVWCPTLTSHSYPYIALGDFDNSLLTSRVQL